MKTVPDIKTHTSLKDWTLLFYESKWLQIFSVQFAVVKTAKKLLPNVHVNAQWLEEML
jgi:hypothetical protein